MTAPSKMPIIKITSDDHVAAMSLALLSNRRPLRVQPIHFGNPDPPTYVEVADPLGEFQREASNAKMPVRYLRTGESFHVDAQTNSCHS